MAEGDDERPVEALSERDRALRAKAALLRQERRRRNEVARDQARQQAALQALADQAKRATEAINAAHARSAEDTERILRGDPVLIERPGPGDAPSAGALVGAIPIRRTQPEELRRHDISDEELDMLKDSRVGRVEQFAWAMVALALGGLTSMLNDFWNAFGAETKTPFGVVELAQFSIVAVGAALAFVAFRFAASQHKRGAELAAQIRARGAK